jgi:hypothetical protein
VSDGVIFLIREIAQSENTELKKDMPKYLSQLPELGLLDQFQSAALLKENLFKSLCDILKAVGKKPFRQYIELYLDPAFRTAKRKRHNYP